MNHQQAIQNAARLYQARDGAKLILGEKFRPYMTAIGEIITEAAEQRKESILDVMTSLAKSALQEDDATSASLIFAAAVELLEPSV